MPSDKRQRQDEGRLNRRVEEVTAAKQRQRRKQLRNVGALLGLLLVVGFLISLRGADDDEPVDTASSSTTVADDATPSSVAAGPGAAIGDSPCPPAEGAAERTIDFASGPQACIDPAKTYSATIETSRGAFTVSLDAVNAPKTVNSFVFLARHRYFEGIAFHRIIPGFVVQGGDPTGSGSGGPGYEFEDELPTAGPPYYEIGSLAMANSGAGTNGSQFFVVTGPQGEGLDPNYSLFGKVTSGLEVVQAIEATGSASGAPSESTTITRVTITEQ